MGEFILCGFQEDDAPQFGKIFDIIVMNTDNNLAFICYQQYLTAGIDRHFHSYVIASTDEECIIRICEDNKFIELLHPLQSHQLLTTPRTLYIVTKNNVFKSW